MAVFWNRLNSKKEEAQFALIQLVSIRRTYLETKDKNKLRKLALTEDRFHLSASQIKAAASRAKETLVVAGAGSGKTSLIVGRALWLIQSQRVPEDEILLLAFNKAAAEEIRTRTAALGVEVKAKTFHSFGLEVLGRNNGNPAIGYTESWQLEKLIQETLTRDIAEEQKQLLAKFFAYSMVPQKNIEDFKDLNEYSAFVKATVLKTLNGEIVKSHGEWLIANFLFANSIDYQYEAKYVGNDGKIHKPDFTLNLSSGRKIYIEYFGTDRQGNTAPWINRKKYNETIEWKKNQHGSNGTVLISLYYYDLKEGNLLKFLEQRLQAKEVRFKPKSSEEVLATANSLGYVTKFVNLCGTFLTHVRAQRLSNHELEERAKNNSRNQAFLQIFNFVRIAYEKDLFNNKLKDYTDLIHESADIISTEGLPKKISHLLVDEFQDISFDRNRLIDSLRIDNPKLEITTVGDDWQSIYKFAGSDVAIMKEASIPVKNRKRVNLGETYRLPQRIADISRDFILANSNQLEKTVISKSPQNEGEIFTHWDVAEGSLLENIALVIDRIGESAQNPEKSLMILARYNSNLPKLAEIESMWEGPIELHSIHSAKGLEADYVIVTDLVQDFRGFPSTIQDDEVFKMIFTKEESFLHAEERRLLYVGMTRARIETHLICPNSAPSEFGRELFARNLGTHIGNSSNESACPVCKSGTILLSKSGTGSYCSNIPICDFRTPSCPKCDSSMVFTPQSDTRYTCINHEDPGINACPACAWGILLERKNSKTGEPFYGCHTYSSTGCNAKVKTSYRR